MEGLTLNIIHNSLKGISKKDSHGNDPFWMRCSAVEQIDSIPIGFCSLESIFSLVEILPFTFDKYRLKTAEIILKQNGGFYRYILDENFNDYDLEPFIEIKECWWRENDGVNQNNFYEQLAK